MWVICLKINYINKASLKYRLSEVNKNKYDFIEDYTNLTQLKELSAGLIAYDLSIVHK